MKYYKYVISIGIILSALIICFINIKPPTQIELAGMIPGYSEEEIILKSDIVVLGTVKSIGDGKWSNPDLEPNKRNVIQTDIEILISKILWGEYDKKSVTVRIDKGYDKKTNTEMKSEGYPDFKNGEEVVLFLARDDSDIATNEDYFVLTGMRQGKLSINNQKANKDILTIAELMESKVVGCDEKFENESISSLNEMIKMVKENNPDWKEKQALKQKEIIERNKKLFGE